MLAGTPDLRTPSGWRRLREGELVSFAVGEEGAHQIVNRSEEAVRFLAVSTSGTPDIVLYPDSDKAYAGERNPDGSGTSFFFRQADGAVPYLEGESPPSLG